MRKMIILTARILSLGLLFLSGEAQAAYCVPEAHVKSSCIGGYCEKLGDTKLDADNQNIVACLSELPKANPIVCSATGGCTWRMMTSSGKFAVLERAPFGDLTGFNRFCPSSSLPLQEEPQIDYYDCSNACYYFCMKRSYTSGLLSEWSEDQGIGECSCIH